MKLHLNIIQQDYLKLAEGPPTDGNNHQMLKIIFLAALSPLHIQKYSKLNK